MAHYAQNSSHIGAELYYYAHCSDLLCSIKAICNLWLCHMRERVPKCRSMVLQALSGKRIRTSLTISGDTIPPSEDRFSPCRGEGETEGEIQASKSG